MVVSAKTLKRWDGEWQGWVRGLLEAGWWGKSCLKGGTSKLRLLKGREPVLWRSGAEHLQQRERPWQSPTRLITSLAASLHLQPSCTGDRLGGTSPAICRTIYEPQSQDSLLPPIQKSTWRLLPYFTSHFPWNTFHAVDLKSKWRVTSQWGLGSQDTAESRSGCFRCRPLILLLSHPASRDTLATAGLSPEDPQQSTWTTEGGWACKMSW